MASHTKNNERVVLGPGEGRVVRIPGHPATLKTDRTNTRGAYTLAEMVVTSQGPPQHIHHDCEEAFYVLEGEIEVRVGERTVHATAGSFVLIPRGTVHAFRGLRDTPAKILVIVSPSGLEKFFDEVVGNDEIDLPTFARRVAIAAPKYGMEIVGPPLGSE